MSHPDLAGRFLWYELLTADRRAAADFYCSVMGWTTELREAGEEPYMMWMNGDHPVGGVMELPEEARRDGAPPHWLPYVGVPGVGEAAERAVELGGNVLLAPMEIPEVGRIAVLTDRAGAPIAVFDPGETMAPPDDPRGLGEFSWHELATDDRRSAMEFYGALFGWEPTGEFDMGEMGTYQMYGLGGTSYGGMYEDPEMPPSWLVYGRVADLGRALDRVRAGGGEAPSEPMEVPGGDLVAQCADPQGAVFALHQVIEAGAPTDGDDSAETAAGNVV